MSLSLYLTEIVDQADPVHTKDIGWFHVCMCERVVVCTAVHVCEACLTFMLISIIEYALNHHIGYNCFFRLIRMVKAYITLILFIIFQIGNTQEGRVYFRIGQVMYPRNKSFTGPSF